MKTHKYITVIFLSTVSHLVYAAGLPNGQIINVQLDYDNNFFVNGYVNSQGENVSVGFSNGSGYPAISISNNGQTVINDPYIYSFSESFHFQNSWSINYNGSITQIDQIHAGNPYLKLPYVHMDDNQFYDSPVLTDSQFLDVKLSIMGNYIGFDFYVNISDGQNWLYIQASLLDFETLRLDLSAIELIPEHQYTLDIQNHFMIDTYFEGYSEGDLVITGTAINKGGSVNAINFTTAPSDVIPEPSSYASICGIVLVGTMLARRKRK